MRGQRTQCSTQSCLTSNSDNDAPLRAARRACRHLNRSWQVPTATRSAGGGPLRHGVRRRVREQWLAPATGNTCDAAARAPSRTTVPETEAGASPQPPALFRSSARAAPVVSPRRDGRDYQGSSRRAFRAALSGASQSWVMSGVRFPGTLRISSAAHLITRQAQKTKTKTPSHCPAAKSSSIIAASVRY